MAYYHTGSPAYNLETYKQQEREEQKEIQEEPETLDKIIELGTSAIPAAQNLLGSINKLEETKLLDSELLDKTFKAENVDGVVESFDMFENASSGDFGDTIQGYINKSINDSSAAWSTRLRPTQEALDADAKGTINIKEELRNKNYSDKEIMNIVVKDKPVSEMAKFSTAFQTGSNPKNLFGNIYEANKIEINAGTGEYPLNQFGEKMFSQVDKMGFAMGKLATGATAIGGGFRAAKGAREGDAGETIHGLINMATPWLMAANPMFQGIVAINTVVDLFD